MEACMIRWILRTFFKAYLDQAVEEFFTWQFNLKEIRYHDINKQKGHLRYSLYGGHMGGQNDKQIFKTLKILNFK